MKVYKILHFSFSILSSETFYLCPSYSKSIYAKKNVFESEKKALLIQIILIFIICTDGRWKIYIHIYLCKNREYAINRTNK